MNLNIRQNRTNPKSTPEGNPRISKGSTTEPGTYESRTQTKIASKEE